MHIEILVEDDFLLEVEALYDHIWDKDLPITRERVKELQVIAKFFVSAFDLAEIDIDKLWVSPDIKENWNSAVIITAMHWSATSSHLDFLLSEFDITLEYV